MRILLCCNLFLLCCANSIVLWLVSIGLREFNCVVIKKKKKNPPLCCNLFLLSCSLFQCFFCANFIMTCFCCVATCLHCVVLISLCFRDVFCTLYCAFLICDPMGHNFLFYAKTFIKLTLMTGFVFLGNK